MDIEQPTKIIREAVSTEAKEVDEENVDERKILVAPPKRDPLKPEILCCNVKTGGWYGSNIVLWQFTEDSKRFPFVCMLGPDFLCGFITYILHFVPWIMFLNFRFSEMNVAGQFITTSLCLIQLSNLLVLTLSNPGILPKVFGSELDVQDLKDMGHRVCVFCKIARPPKTQHCYSCDVCVENLDHHCPWTGKCIGKNNIHSFYFFLALIPISVVFMAMSLSFFKD
jgi:hypothetical protein